jgi:hypothetical protein
VRAFGWHRREDSTFTVTNPLGAKDDDIFHTTMPAVL